MERGKNLGEEGFLRNFDRAPAFVNSRGTSVPILPFVKRLSETVILCLFPFILDGLGDSAEPLLPLVLIGRLSLSNPVPLESLHPPILNDSYK